MTIMIDAVLTGKAVPFRDEEDSAIGKHAVAGPLTVGTLGLEGDEQADLTVHGGPDKAIHHYPRDHYPAWNDWLDGHTLLDTPGGFGENISTHGLTEAQICIGDRLRLGTALVEVSQGRQPCWKLDHRFGTKGVSGEVVRSGRSGWYYRVLEPGQVMAGDSLTIIDRPWPQWTVARVFGLLIGGKAKLERDALGDLVEVDELAEPWKRRLASLMMAGR